MQTFKWSVELRQHVPEAIQILFVWSVVWMLIIREASGKFWPAAGFPKVEANDPRLIPWDAAVIDLLWEGVYYGIVVGLAYLGYRLLRCWVKKNKRRVP